MTVLKSKQRRSSAASRALDPAVANALDQTLSDLLTLDLVIRQARRHLARSSAFELHRLVGGLADVAREVGNGIAARSLQLGHNANLWAETTARRDAVRLMEALPSSDAATYSAFALILDSITDRLEANIRATDCDLVTQSLLIRLADRFANCAWAVHTPPAA
jgi:DNA-binding ferritin-like protein